MGQVDREMRQRSDGYMSKADYNEIVAYNASMPDPRPVVPQAEAVAPPPKKRGRPRIVRVAEQVTPVAEVKEVRMTWGKYQGKTVKDVIEFDKKYTLWLYRQEFVKKFEDIYRVLDEYFKGSA